MEDYKKLIAVFLVGLLLGEIDGYYFDKHKKDVSQPKIGQSQQIQTNAEVKTETKVVYVPKETIRYIDSNGKEITTLEKTDIQANIGKPSINVKLNDKLLEIKKSDDEKFVFDKNKLILDQTSKIMIETKIEPVKIDKTKHWGLGIGYGSHKTAGAILFPVDKSKNIDGWLYGDKDTKCGGLMFRF